ncbi:MAG TPA: GGDEF domain-containing protein [Gemmatimonadaceae bacterium]|nr:GGDEF domain-containing protein [Gemmatimonadaceae bacterium]
MRFSSAAIMPLVGALLQLGGAALLVGFFVLLRRYVFRRPYFSAWLNAWIAITTGIFALVLRYLLDGRVGPSLPEGSFAVRSLYFVYQAAKLLAFVFFLRGTIMYVAGSRAATGRFARHGLVIGAVAVAAISAFLAQSGLNEMVIWQSLFAVPLLGYCGSALLWLPRSRRTLGTVSTGVGFSLLAGLWFLYGGAFALAVGQAATPLASAARTLIALNPYCDLLLDVLLGYGMVVMLMEDAKREVADAQTELRLSHDRLSRAAMFDSLTDSLNRRAFVEGVGLEMARATFGTVVIADVDNLKQVNDTHGHAVGDLLIRRCADVLRSALRPYDKLYRWGGDEFLLVVPSAHANDMLDRLRAALITAEAVESPMDGRRVRVDVSIGGADYASAEEINAAIDRADLAMYEDKSRRKGEPRNSPAALRLSHIASLR